MKVWIVSYEQREEESSYMRVDSVWSSEELADKRLAEIAGYYLSAEYQDFEIDKPVEP